MDVQSLKSYIYENGKIERVLDELGCHNIRHNEGRGYYAATMPDGDNPSGVVVSDNKWLDFRSYSRGIGLDDQQDIINLIQIVLDIGFVDAIKWLHSLFDLEFIPYVKEVRPPKEHCLQTFRDIKDARGAVIDASEIREISEEAFDDYTPILHIDWFREGIMPWAADKFELCYSYKHKRMVIPLRYWADGRLLGFNQRTMIDNYKELGVSKYFITPSYRKGVNLYGLWENKDEIEKAKRVVVVESEKSVLKRFSHGDPTCVALQGKTMTYEQVRIIRGLNVNEVIIALDKDVDVNAVRCICDKFYKAVKVSYVRDDFGYMGDKDSPCDCHNWQYEELIDNRVEYGKREHEAYQRFIGKGTV